MDIGWFGLFFLGWAWAVIGILLFLWSFDWMVDSVDVGLLLFASIMGPIAILPAIDAKNVPLRKNEED